MKQERGTGYDRGEWSEYVGGRSRDFFGIEELTGNRQPDFLHGREATKERFTRGVVLEKEGGEPWRSEVWVERWECLCLKVEILRDWFLRLNFFSSSSMYRNGEAPCRCP